MFNKIGDIVGDYQVFNLLKRSGAAINVDFGILQVKSEIVLLNSLK